MSTKSKQFCDIPKSEYIRKSEWRDPWTPKQSIGRSTTITDSRVEEIWTFFFLQGEEEDFRKRFWKTTTVVLNTCLYYFEEDAFIM